jgi:hypothetical protein
MRHTKKAPVCIIHMERTETGFELNPEDLEGEELQLVNQSGALFGYKWDWGEGAYTNPFQAYRLLKNYTPSDISDTFEYDRAVSTSRTRLRGRGTSLGFQIKSDGSKDLRLLGYGILFTLRDTI